MGQGVEGGMSDFQKIVKEIDDRQRAIEVAAAKAVRAWLASGGELSQGSGSIVDAERKIIQENPHLDRTYVNLTLWDALTYPADYHRTADQKPSTDHS